MFQKIVPYAFIISIFCSHAVCCMETEQEAKSAFIAKQGDTFIKEVGKCDERYAPFSTFKVALALMGFDAGILESKDSPKWSFEKEYEDNFPWFVGKNKSDWLGDHTPETFMEKSVLWFSHQITAKLEKEKFQGYVSKLTYGNQDVSGGPLGSLLDSWLGTSLQISPREQLEFVEKLLMNKLDLSEDKDAQAKTREIMDRKETWNGWKLYGKTGGGIQNNGWFIGWIEKEEAQPIVFAQYLDLDDPNLDLTDISIQKSVGRTAKKVAKRHLKDFWQELGDK